MSTTLAPPSPCPHIVDMDRTREDAIRKALELHPGSLRSLAREAGVSVRLLVLIRDGERTATPVTVAKVADALERWTERTAEATRVLRNSLQTEGGEDG